MKAADKLIAIALAVGSLLFLGWLVLRFFLPATLPFWLGLTIAALLHITLPSIFSLIFSHFPPLTYTIFIFIFTLSRN